MCKYIFYLKKFLLIWKFFSNKINKIQLHFNEWAAIIIKLEIFQFKNKINLDAFKCNRSFKKYNNNKEEWA